MIRILIALLTLCVSAFAEETAYAQLSSISTQIPVSSKATPVTMDSVDLLHNFDISPKKDRLIAKLPGMYFLIASGQCASINKTTTGYLDMWFVKNSKPLTNTNARLTVDRPLSTTVIITQIIVALAPGDTIGTDFSSSGPNLGFEFSQPDNEPANTSFFFSIFKID